MPSLSDQEPQVPRHRPVCAEWTKVETEDGRPYYWNEETDETRWDLRDVLLEKYADIRRGVTQVCAVLFSGSSKINSVGKRKGRGFVSVGLEE